MMNFVGGSATILDPTIFFDNKRLTFSGTYSTEGAEQRIRLTCDDVLNKRIIILVERIASLVRGHGTRIVPASRR